MCLLFELWWLQGVWMPTCLCVCVIARAIFILVWVCVWVLIESAPPPINYVTWMFHTQGKICLFHQMLFQHPKCNLQEMYKTPWCVLQPRWWKGFRASNVCQLVVLTTFIQAKTFKKKRKKNCQEFWWRAMFLTGWSVITTISIKLKYAYYLGYDPQSNYIHG